MLTLKKYFKRKKMSYFIRVDPDPVFYYLQERVYIERLSQVLTFLFWTQICVRVKLEVCRELSKIAYPTKY